MAKNTKAAVPADAETGIIPAVEETLEGLKEAFDDQKEIKVVTTCRLLEPYLFIRFAAGVPTVVPEITNWMKAQIEAGLMKEV